jgi:hypothetical protein
MPTEIKKEIQLEIAHVLLIDIVAYSKFSLSDSVVWASDSNSSV